MRTLREQCEILAAAMVILIMLYVIWWGILNPAISTLLRLVPGLGH